MDRGLQGIKHKEAVKFYQYQFCGMKDGKEHSHEIKEYLSHENGDMDPTSLKLLHRCLHEVSVANHHIEVHGQEQIVADLHVIPSSVLKRLVVTMVEARKKEEQHQEHQHN